MFEVELKLAPGIYEYKFLVNGSWCLDPTKPSETNLNDIENNILIVSMPLKLHFSYELKKTIQVESKDDKDTKKDLTVSVMKTIEEITEDPFVDVLVQTIQNHANFTALSEEHASPVHKSEPQLSSDKISVASNLTVLEKETLTKKLERIGEETKALNLITKQIEEEIQKDAIDTKQNLSNTNNCLDVRILKEEIESSSQSNKSPMKQGGNEALSHEEKDATGNSEEDLGKATEEEGTNYFEEPEKEDISSKVENLSSSEKDSVEEHEKKDKIIKEGIFN